MDIPIWFVDVFTSRLFSGNTAAVCRLDTWLRDEDLLAIASQNRVSETAFWVDKEEGPLALRWFSKSMEVDLCGHGTLAVAHVIFSLRSYGISEISFSTLSGILTTKRNGNRLALRLPSRPPSSCEVSSLVGDALGKMPLETLCSERDLLVLYQSEDDIRALVPNMSLLTQLPQIGIIVTAPGGDCDFVSRFFAPRGGVPEDPATGSAHCTLVPYWANRLGKKKFVARQLSKRGGILYCEFKDTEVCVEGETVIYLEGTIHLPS